MRRWSTLVICAAPLVVAVWLAALALRWHSVHDAQLMNYLGWRILEGDRPYVDFVDMNFPGVYVLHAALVGLGGDIDAATAAANVLLMGAIAVLAGVLVSRTAGRGPAGWVTGAVSVIALMKAGPYDIFQRDTLTIPLLLAATTLLVTSVERARPTRAVGVAGLLIGCAMTIKPAALAWGGAALLAAGLAQTGMGMAALLRLWAAGAAGIALAWVPVLVWLWSRGSLTPFIAMIRGYLPLYAAIDYAVILGAPAPNPVRLLIDEALRTDLLAVVRAWGVLLSLGALLWGDWRLRVAAASMLGALAGFVAQGKGWAYHLLPAYVMAIVVAACVWNRVRTAPDRPAWWLPLHGVTLLALAAVTLSGVRAASYASADRLTPKTAQVLELADYVRRHPTPDDSLQAIDSTVGGLDVLLRLQRRNATPLVYDFHVLFGGDGSSWVTSLRHDVAARLNTAPPDRVLVFRHGWPRAGYERLRHFPALEELLHVRYEIEREGEEYRLFRRRPAS